jgi:hypothetical protein
MVAISTDPKLPWNAYRVHEAMRVEALNYGATPAGMDAVKRSIAALEAKGKIVRDGRGWKPRVGVHGSDKAESKARACELYPQIAGDLAKRRADFAEALLISHYLKRAIE